MKQIELKDCASVGMKLPDGTYKRPIDKAHLFWVRPGNQQIIEYKTTEIMLYMSLSQHVDRGYYTAARGENMQFFLSGKNNIYERVSKYCFLPQENKFHIFKPPCNFLFTI